MMPDDPPPPDKPKPQARTTGGKVKKAAPKPKPVKPNQGK
jgi:hypothetical protein